MIRLRLATAVLLLWLAGPVLAQTEAATLLADRVEVAGTDAITAEGNVEVLYGDIRLTATRVTYERAGDRLLIEGPITLTEGETVAILADAAELDADLRRGILTGARMVLDRQLQLASPRIDRVDGRYTQLARTVASSCQVCPEDPVPLWEIRARRVIHDQQERQLYFEGAQFRFSGVPIAYIPYLRLPDPSVERATGFLFPEVVTSSLLGTGVRVPYFIAIGDHADVTLTPYLSDVTTTLIGRYRQEFSFGRLTVDGAVSRDTLSGNSRAYLFARGLARLPADFRLRFNLELVSDPAYLNDYDFSGQDRLESEIAVTRTRNDEDIRLSATAFRTLRGTELAFKDQLADRLAEAHYVRRLSATPLGGDAWLTLEAIALSRPSEDDILGRDVARAGATVDWRRSWIIGPGIVAEAEAGLGAWAYSIANDSTYSDTVTRVVPRVAATLRWPLRRAGSGGAVHLIEPAVQVGWSEVRGGAVPNEDSATADFDEGNLFAPSRFPGADRTEEGLRASLGVTYTRYDPNGWSLGTTVGRIYRGQDYDGFVPSSGLDGRVSDWLLAFDYQSADLLRIQSRTLLANFDEITRTEFGVTITGERATLSSLYVFAEADPADNRPDPTSEWTLNASYGLTDTWTGLVNWRYDTDEGRAERAGLGLRFENECLRADLSLSRRFASSATVTPRTELSFEVAIGSLGRDGNSRGYRRTCRG